MSVIVDFCRRPENNDLFQLMALAAADGLSSEEETARKNTFKDALNAETDVEIVDRGEYQNIDHIGRMFTTKYGSELGVQLTLLFGYGLEEFGKSLDVAATNPALTAEQAQELKVKAYGVKSYADKVGKGLGVVFSGPEIQAQLTQMQSLGIWGPQSDLIANDIKAMGRRARPKIWSTLGRLADGNDVNNAVETFKKVQRAETFDVYIRDLKYHLENTPAYSNAVLVHRLAAGVLTEEQANAVKAALGV